MEKVNNDDVYETCDDIDAYLEMEKEPESKKKLTSDQLRVVNYYRKIEKIFNNSLKILRQPLSKFSLLSENTQKFENVEQVVERVVELTNQQKTINDELVELRPLLKELLLKATPPKGEPKLFYRGYIASVSQGKRTSTKKFDVEKFKAENPEMYEKYCFKTYSGGFGGNLSLRSITEKQATELRRLNKKAEEKLTWEK